MRVLSSYLYAVTVVSEYPHSTFKGIPICSYHSGTQIVRPTQLVGRIWMRKLSLVAVCKPGLYFLIVYIGLKKYEKWKLISLCHTQPSHTVHIVATYTAKLVFH